MILIWPLRFHLIFGSILILVAKLIEIYIPLRLGKMVSQFTKGPFPFQEMKQEGFLLAGLILVALLLEIFVAFYRNWISERGQIDLRERLFSHTLHQKIPFYDKGSVGKLINQIVNDIDKIREMWADSIIAGIGTIGLFIAISLGALFTNPTVAIGLFPLIPLTVFLFTRFRTKQQTAYDHFRKSLADQHGFLQEHLLGHQTIRSFTPKALEGGEFAKINDSCMLHNFDANKTFSWFISLIDMLVGFAYIGAFTLFALLATEEKPFASGPFFTFSLWSMMLFRPLADFAERYNVFLAGLAAVKRVRPLFEEEAEPVDQNDLLPLDHIEEISFQDVHFHYTPGHEVLKGCSFSIKKGESVGLIGITGGGKSTIVNLLLRFYVPQKGLITINNIPIERYQLKSLRSAFSLVLQEPLLFKGTVEENIRFFRKGITKEEIGPCPLANHTLRSQVQFMGSNLSEGERQLLSLKRASVAKKALLILDEATSSVDPLSELAIQHELQSLIGSQTSLIIAHRLSTIASLTKILLLHDGRIVEEGPFDLLIGQKGHFYSLWNLFKLENL